ncbi:iron complex outermembrane recepter protein [Methylophilus rhizosphaerae]|uniref:Iron complex outermembrane recepter protein n=1 Tax=Methylophilus rhizosphaerae TaxID=492660 RepID=A0A1G8ZQH5_9PROT|nr:TonB-dependent siderophore receptor [Methylophilus rhizosphaerae]SDK17366.1 iron complex outermembrane recepter protein [Methylophilus rhizosphaerae]
MKSNCSTLLARNVRAALFTLMLGGISSITPLQAAEPEVALHEYHIPAGSLSQVLSHFAAEAGIMLSGDASLADGISSQGLQGRYSVQSGLDALLKGSGLQVEYRGDTRYSIIQMPAKENVLPEVQVTAALEKEKAWSPVQGYVAKRSATGSKTDTPIIETPQSVSVVTKDFIKAIGAQTLKEGMAYTPGVNIAPYGPDSRYDWIALRGVDAYSPGFYQDGLQWRNSGNFALWRVENYGTERLEILRGPSSVLYGQNSAGGMINVVSKRPTETPIKEIQVQLGNFQRRQIAGDFSGALNEDGSVLYRITGLVRDAELPRQHMDDDHMFIAPSLTIKPSDKTTLTLMSQYMHSQAGVFAGALPEQGSLVRTPAGGKLSYDTFVGDKKFNRFDQKQWYVGYLLEHQFNDQWAFRQNARYSEIDLDYWQVFGGDYRTVNATPADPDNYRYLTRSMTGSPEKVKAFTIDNQIEDRFQLGNWQHTILFGLDYQHVKDNYQSYSDSAPELDLQAPDLSQAIPVGSPIADVRVKLAQTGFYLQDQIKWDDHWVATLGGRYDEAKIKQEELVSSGAQQFTDHKFTGRAGLVYLADNGLAPYVSYSESFVPTATLDPVTLKSFKPETGRQYEVGLRYQPVGRREIYSAAIFDLRRNDFITYDPVSFSPRQVGGIQVRGLELEMHTQPLENMSLVTAYTYTPKVEITKSSDPSQVGTPAIATPEHTLAVWSDYRFNSGVKIGLGARFNGMTRGNYDTASEKIPSYTLLDALVGYDLRHWNLAFNVRNLTDKEYVANCNFGSCYYGEPRRATLTATYRW